MSEQFVRLIQRDVHIRTLAGLHDAENVFNRLRLSLRTQ